MSKKIVDRHFAGRIAADEERAMRVHLETCDECRAHYGRHLLLAKLVPGSLPAEERIGRGLGLRRRSPARVVPIAFTVVAVAAALMLFLRGSGAQDGFTPRGPGIEATSNSRILVYRGSGDAAPSLAGGDIRRGDELAFAYENGDRKPYLMIFAVDERGRVFWFHPAWTSEGDDPRAVSASTAPGRHELREAITHPLEGARLEVHGLFLDRAMSVREVESALSKRASPAGPFEISGGIDHVVTLTVSP